MRLKAPLYLLALSIPIGARAQAPFTPSHPAPVQGEAPSFTALDAATFKALVHARYREGAWTEQLTLELSPQGSPSRRTRVQIACDPLADAAPGATRPAVRLDLDNLTIVATPTRFTAINAAAPELAFETALSSSRPFLEQLRELIPAIPFPQLHLALDPDMPRAWEHAIASIAPGVVAPLTVEPAGRVGGLLTLRAQSPSSNDPHASAFEARFLPERGTFIQITAHDTFGTAPVTLRISCQPQDPPLPSVFSIDLTNRQRVDSLARLRPPEPEIKPGMRLPALGLVDDSLVLWSPQAAFNAQRTPLNPPVRLALVFYDAMHKADDAGQSQADDAFEALLLARGLADKYRRDSVATDRTPRPEDPEPLPRVGTVPVAVFEISAFGPEIVREEAIAWSQLGTPGAFTSAGPSLLKRFNPSGGVSIVVIDEGQIVRGVVPWQGRTSAQRRAGLDAALRGIPTTRPTPDQNPDPTTQDFPAP